MLPFLTPDGKPMDMAGRNRMILPIAFVGFLVAFTVLVGTCACASPLVFYASLCATTLALLLSWRLYARLDVSGAALLPTDTHTQPLSIEDAQTGLSITLYTDVRELPQAQWDSFLPQERLFLHTSYLKALQAAPPTNASLRYILAEDQDGRPVAVASFHILSMRDGEIGDLIDGKWLHRLIRPVASLLGESSQSTPVRVLLCGSALGSGEFGFHYDETQIEPQAAFSLLTRMMDRIKREEQQQGRPIGVMAIRDFGPDHQGHAKALPEAGYSPLVAEPAMVVPLDPSWTSMNDYMGAMSAKYRKRVKDARKYGKGLIKSQLNAEQIEANSGRIKELFDNVIGQAGFRLTNLEPTTFVQMKRELPEAFHFTAYHLEEKMVGFTVLYTMGEESEAHLVGIDYEYNIPTRLYQNMLYDFIECSMEHGCKCVHMGRTALEIKSTVGAEPVDLAFYVRHSHPLYNSLIRPALSLIPETEWTQRRPFDKGPAPAPKP